MAYRYVFFFCIFVAAGLLVSMSLYVICDFVSTRKGVPGIRGAKLRVIFFFCMFVVLYVLMLFICRKASCANVLDDLSMKDMTVFVYGAGGEPMGTHTGSYAVRTTEEGFMLSMVGDDGTLRDIKSVDGELIYIRRRNLEPAVAAEPVPE